MALTATNLTQLCTGGGNSLWLYRTTEADGTVTGTSGYFNDFVDSMNIGDVIFLFSGVGGTEEHGVLIVLDNDGTDITLSPINAWTIA